MSLEAIYILRHGVRCNFEVDHKTGVYSCPVPSPTGIPADVPLAARGVEQSRELIPHLMGLDPPIQAVFSSPFYRCLQTVRPFLEERNKSSSSPRPLLARCDAGLGEFYSAASYEQPAPASPAVLERLFPDSLDAAHTPTGLRARRHGESVRDLHERTAGVARGIVARADAEGLRAILIVTHAATGIALSRWLVELPEDLCAGDFRIFMGGLSTFRRRSKGSEEGGKEGGGMGEWVCEINSDSSFLSQGGERGWDFSMYPGELGAIVGGQTGEEQDTDSGLVSASEASPEVATGAGAKAPRL